MAKDTTFVPKKKMAAGHIADGSRMKMTVSHKLAKLKAGGMDPC
jgi:hypothetical protein